MGYKIDAIDNDDLDVRSAQQKRLMEQWQALIDQAEEGKEPDITLLQSIGLLAHHHFAQFAHLYSQFLEHHLREHDIQACKKAHNPNVVQIVAHIALPIILNVATLGAVIVPAVGHFPANQGQVFKTAAEVMKAGADISNQAGSFADSKQRGKQIELDGRKDDTSRNLNDNNQKAGREQQDAQKMHDALQAAQRQEHEMRRLMLNANG